MGEAALVLYQPEQQLEMIDFVKIQFSRIKQPFPGEQLTKKALAIIHDWAAGPGMYYILSLLGIDSTHLADTIIHSSHAGGVEHDHASRRSVARRSDIREIIGTRYPGW